MKPYKPVEPPNACPAADCQDREPTGAITNYDSAFRHTEAFVAVNTAAIIDNDDKNQSDVITSETVGARFTHGAITAYAAGTSALIGIHPALPEPGEMYSHTDRGNFQGGVGWRWRSIPYDVKEHDLGDSYRRAIALRVDAAHGYDQPEDNAIIERHAFSTMEFTPGWNGRAMLEVRYELIGCFAPFIHTQVGAIVSSGERVDIPASLAIGVRQTRTLTILGEYGLLWRTESGASQEPAQRIRIGLDWSPLLSVVNLGAAFEINLGDIDGVFFAALASIPFAVAQ